MKIDPHHQKQFASASATPMSPADLFLPDVEAVVRHLARMVAERDFRAFTNGTQLSYDHPRIGEDRHA